jgi:hypothetical protein
MTLTRLNVIIDRGKVGRDNEKKQTNMGKREYVERDTERETRRTDTD